MNPTCNRIANAATFGLRRVHLTTRSAVVIGRARIGSFFSQRSSSSARASAEE